ncbi:hypothetical protein GSI_09513 [Ganoderma sinense ZZ0214-1]|uniref:Glucose-methanol-choline oxidoreductase N-terminal domain-containing protein n=1 Tax=Ganoderma sinense ZZ0214-1 TaxID=1077348 RepID=A0A2G8S3L7_9APHY|nr:hypothetical protein GSI_09513 [Ganoderma sinense ZZ0214-1]
MLVSGTLGAFDAVLLVVMSHRSRAEQYAWIAVDDKRLLDEYDIIAGGGTAGGVILGRLAAADPSLRILMLEAGPPTKDDLAHHIQLAPYLTHIVPDSDTVKHVVDKPSDDLNGRQLTMQRGNCAHVVQKDGVHTTCCVDHNDWAKVHNNHGWNFDELLPLIKQIETYQVALGKPFHGYDGPLKVSRGGASGRAPRDKDGIVDSRLNVYGVQNFKVADMISICPFVIAANGCATGALVGEKVALIIAEEIEIGRGLWG